MAQAACSDDPSEPSAPQAKRDALSIGYCVNGFYIGICDGHGECQRKSVETWPSRDAARRALETNDWTSNDR